MKLYAFFITLMVCSGCHTSSVIKAPSLNERMDDCNVIYHHVLEMTFDKSVDPNHEYTRDKRAYGIQLLDDQYLKSDTRQKFFMWCITKMSEEQIACAEVATTVEGIDTCNHLITK